jgi:hypothetical protein
MNNKSNSLVDNKLLSSAGFLLGAIGVLISLGSLSAFIDENFFTITLPIIFGSIGFVFLLKSCKEIKDDVVKVGLVINPISVLLGGLQIFI